MLLLMIEAGMPIDCVITADTGMEFPEMYQHWDKLDQVLYQERGIHLTVLRHPKGFEWLMFDQPKEKPRTLQTREALGVTPYGGIFGTFFVCGISGDNFSSLTPEQMKTYKARFRKAEVILAISGGSVMIGRVDAKPKQPPETSGRQ